MVELFLDHGIASYDGWTSSYDTPFHEALFKGDLDIAQIFIDHGADLAGVSSHSTEWIQRVESRRPDLIRFLLKNGQLDSHLQVSSKLEAVVAADDLHLTQELLNRDVERNKKECPFLIHIAAGCRNDDILALLVASGWDIRRKDGYGLSPLHHAVRYGHHAAIRRRLSAGADVNDRPGESQLRWNDYPWPALQVASHRGFARIVSMLVDAGADIFYRAQDGKTALDRAITNCHCNTALVLLRAGAPFAVDSPACPRLLFDEFHMDLEALMLKAGVNPTFLMSGEGAPKLDQQHKRAKEVESLLASAMVRLATNHEGHHPDSQSYIRVSSCCAEFFHRDVADFENYITIDYGIHFSV